MIISRTAVMLDHGSDLFNISGGDSCLISKNEALLRPSCVLFQCSVLILHVKVIRLHQGFYSSLGADRHSVMLV